MKNRGLGSGLLALAIMGAASMLGTGCSSSDDGAAGYCATWNGRERECGILGEGKTSCADYNDKAEPCEIECIKRAPCAEIVSFACGGDPTSALATCAARCVGLEPFTCADGKVIAAYSRCDGFEECADASDEQGCTMTGFKCRTTAQYVPSAKRCDDHKDCLDGTDENADCAVTLMCKVGGTLTGVRSFNVCDGVPTCDDESDEPIACAPPIACPNPNF